MCCNLWRNTFYNSPKQHHRHLPWLLAIWSTILLQNNNIAIILSTILSNVTIWWTMLWQYSAESNIMTVLFTISSISTLLISNVITILCNHMGAFSTILAQYLQFSLYCVKILLSYIVTILSKMLLWWKTQ